MSWSDDGDRSSRIGTGRKHGKDGWIFFSDNVLSTCFIKEKLYKDSWKLEWLVVKADLFRLDFPVSLPTILGKVLPFRFSW